MTDLQGDPDQPVNHPLMGRRVTVTLARKGDHPDGPCPIDPFDLTPCPCPPLPADITATGTLNRLDAGGGFTLTLPDGTTISGWPALDIATPAGEPLGNHP